MRIPDKLEKFLEKLYAGQDLNELYVPNNSPLWPGFSLIHLATILSRNTDEEYTDGKTFDLMSVILNKNHTMLYKSEIHGWTPLQLAYRQDKRNATKILLKLHNLLDNSPHNAVDENGLSYMHIACAINNKAFLEKLLLNHSSVNAVYQGKSVFSSKIHPRSTPLHVAVTCKNKEIVKMLLKHGADVNAKDANDMTPIHLSFATSYFFEISKILLSSCDLKNSVASRVELSHLHVACYSKHEEAIKRLVADGADVNQVILKAGEESRHLSWYTGSTPLSFAVKAGSKSAVACLLEGGADFFLQLPDGNSLLSKLIYHFHKHSLPYVSEDVYLQSPARMEMGLTKLHLACYNDDVRSAREILLKNEEDVNVRIYKTSPSWPGFTPLHVITFDLANDEDDYHKMIELLIHKGADVTLLNNESETPVHLAYKRLISNEKEEKIFAYVNRLLEAQRDFSVNPVNAEGLTHFHIASSLCNVAVIEEFLKYGSVDVNQPIDSLFDKPPDIAGSTPLLLARLNQWSNEPQRLQTAKLLLEHGANANVTDLYGNAILHECAISKFLDIFEILVRHGADVNLRNLMGCTPLQFFISNNNFTSGDMKTLLRLGCRFNVYNTSNEVGYIGFALKSISCRAMEILMPALTFNFSHLIETDDMNRTAIHNIVSVPECGIPVDVYATLIEQLTVTGCDIDDQDKAGRTALHLAAKFRNFNAISALLMLGADVNIIDSSGKTPFTCEFALCNRRNESDGEDDSDNDNDNNDDGSCYGTCEHFKMHETFAVCVRKLKSCGLDVDPLNENLALEAYRKFPSENIPSERFFKDLEEMKNAKIGLYSLSLKDFISENRAVADYPTMSEMKRKVVNKFFSRGQTRRLRQKFSETAGILQLQYRKAVARVQLVGDAKNSLIILLGLKLPDLCSEMVFKFLANSDLKVLNSTAEVVT